MFFRALFAKGTADSIRNSPGLEAKRKSPPRVRQFSQPRRLHEYFLEPFLPRVLRTQSAIRPALRPNESRPRGHAKSRSPQGCMNVFRALFAKGTADSIRNPPGFEAKRKSPPRTCQIPQPAGLHECFLEPFWPRVLRTQSATRPALRPNESRPRGHAKSRSPQGCMNVF